MLVETDIPSIVTQLNSPEIAPWLAALPQPFSQGDADLLFDLSETQDNWVWAMEDAQDGAFIGCICLGTNTWFWLSPQYWQRGIMFAALSTSIDAFFAQRPAPLLATARADNTPSKAVLTSLGFSRKPKTRRMFFQSENRSLACLDFVMTPEQWYAIHPPVLECGHLTMQPATYKHIPELTRILPATPPWPEATADITIFDKFRFRGGFDGLFVIHDDMRQLIGAAHLKPPCDITMHLITSEAANIVSSEIEQALKEGLLPRGYETS